MEEDKDDDYFYNSELDHVMGVEEILEGHHRNNISSGPFDSTLSLSKTYFNLSNY